MKNKYYFIYCLLLPYLSTIAQEPTKILFIGNSLTSYNDMPKMVQKMFAESNKEVQIFQKTKSGLSLKLHLDLINSAGQNTDGFVLDLNTFKEEQFDYIILQEATVRLLIPESQGETIKSINSFKDIAHQSNSKVLFYQPYPTYNYPKKHCFPSTSTSEIFCSEEITNSTQELGVLLDFCKKISSKSDIQIIPIGSYFEQVNKEFPNYELLNDGEHPNNIGSYLIAYSIYSTIMKHDIKNKFLFIEESDKIKVENILEFILKNK